MSESTTPAFLSSRAAVALGGMAVGALILRAATQLIEAKSGILDSLTQSGPNEEGAAAAQKPLGVNQESYQTSELKGEEKTKKTVSARIRILHISDTHNKHEDLTKWIERIPKSDMLIHTGDFADNGLESEMEDFNLWLGKIKHRFPLGIYVIAGNHDWKRLAAERKEFLDGKLEAEGANPKYGYPNVNMDYIRMVASDKLRRKYLQNILHNADGVLEWESKVVNVPTLLSSESEKAGLQKKGDFGGEEGGPPSVPLTMFGAAWSAWGGPTHPDKIKRDHGHELVFEEWKKLQDSSKFGMLSNLEADGEMHRYNEIPGSIEITGVVANGTEESAGPEQVVPLDILLTHHPAKGVFDGQKNSWGSSEYLRERIQNHVKPGMHLFGHVHGQNGFWEYITKKEDIFPHHNMQSLQPWNPFPVNKETTLIGGVTYGDLSRNNSSKSWAKKSLSAEETNLNIVQDKKNMYKVQLTSNAAAVDKTSLSSLFAKKAMGVNVGHSIVSAPTVIDGEYCDGQWKFTVSNVRQY